MSQEAKEVFLQARRLISRGYIESTFHAPGAYWTGDNYFTLNPSRGDKTIGSFSIRSDGVWFDHSDGSHGDIFDLLASMNGTTSFIEASRLVGLDGSTPHKPDEASFSRPKVSERPTLELSWLPIPDDKVPKFQSEPSCLTLYKVGGKPCFYVARFDLVEMDSAGVKKQVKQIYPVFYNGASFVKGLPGITTRPLLEVEPDKPIVILEGEKKTEDARACPALGGYAFTCWHGGAAAAKKVDVTSLIGRDVILWPDNDKVGFSAMSDIAEKIKDVAHSVRLVIIPKNKPKAWDIGDAIEEREDVANLLSLAPDYGYLKEAIEIDDDDPVSIAQLEKPRVAAIRNYSDLGNAERFIDMWGNIIRYNKDRGMWLIWHRGRWRSDDQTLITLMYKRTIRTIATRSDADAVTWAMSSERAGAISAMLSLARMERGIPEQLDQEPFIFNCPNGCIDLVKGTLLEPNRDWLCTKSSEVMYKEEAECPRFLTFLQEIFCGNQGVIDFMQRWFGYCMTSDMGAQSFVIFYGSGANGKSTLVELISRIMGAYSKPAAPDTFIQKQAGGVPNDIAALKGARMVLTTETEANARLAESKIKAMTGGDRVSARFMRQDFFEFTPTWKIIISTNHRPKISGGDYGIWRRVILIPFDFVPPRPDHDLSNRLWEEREGILAWMVKGAKKWADDGGGRGGLRVPEVLLKETQDYREDEDIVGRFISEGCYSETEIRDRRLPLEVRAADMYMAFKAWAEKEGEAYYAKITMTVFGRAMRERGQESKRLSSGKYYYGIQPKERGGYYEGSQVDSGGDTRPIRERD
jgi:putative DNA primase/helicase